MKTVFHAAAVAELTEAVAYYASIDPQLGQRFLLEMEQLIREVVVHPQTFRQFDPPARRHFSLSFPYGMIYLQEADRALDRGRHAPQARARLLEGAGGMKTPSYYPVCRPEHMATPPSINEFYLLCCW